MQEQGLLIIGGWHFLVDSMVSSRHRDQWKVDDDRWAGYLLEELKHDAFIGGNLGDPIAGWALEGYPGESGILELSSYHLRRPLALHHKSQ